MRRAILWSSLMALVLVAAAGVRVARLNRRPMHADEAVHAIKLGQLLARGEYRYDPDEYHGPTLNFLSWPLVRLLGVASIEEAEPFDLRLLPVLAGVGLVALTWALRDSLGRGAALAAGVLCAASPMMVFYSRYYIQEMLLVLFTFGAIVCLYRARHVGGNDDNLSRKIRLRRWAWLLGGGVSLGLMHATKETCIIAWGAMGTAGIVTWAWERLAGWQRPQTRPGRTVLSVLVVIAAAAFVSICFYASFGTHLSGPADSIHAYLNYFDRASGVGSAGRHVQPWFYYLRLLVWPGGGTWTEAGIVVLALAGIVAGAAGHARALGLASASLVRFLAIYTLTLLGIYSALPYKTPWCALGALHGLIVLAGIGAAALVRLPRRWVLKVPGLVLVLAIVAHLGWQAWRIPFPSEHQARIPYAYSPTSADVTRLADLLSDLAAASGHGMQMPVQVIFPDEEYWPLPWYLREFTRVDWSSEVPTGAAPVIITRPGLETELSEQLYERTPTGLRRVYVRAEGGAIGKAAGQSPELRPNEPMHVYVRQDLWERWEFRGAPPSFDDR